MWLVAAGSKRFRVLELGELTSQSLSLLTYKMGITINSYTLQRQDVQEMIDVEII